MTYTLLNACFLLVAALVAVVAYRRHPLSARRAWALACALAAVLLLSVVFDNVMIGVGLVAYDPARISGVFLGVAPIEDFAYPVAAALLLPALWTLLAARKPAAVESGDRLPGHRGPGNDGPRDRGERTGR
jgi:lycopene cyclase domain-containing protein